MDPVGELEGSRVGVGERVVVERSGLDRLFDALRSRGYVVIAPRLRDGAIVLDECASAAGLPAGWDDDTEPGRYRLVPRADGGLFGGTVGPDSAKRLLHPADVRLARVRREGAGPEAADGPEPPPARHAFLGLRACDLAAVAVQDRVFLDGPWPDPVYAARRAAALLIAVQCERMGRTCFCDAVGAGPQPTTGFDLALTPRGEPSGGFVAEAGSARGLEVLAALPQRRATGDEAALPQRLAEQARAAPHRALPAGDLRATLAAAHAHPRWDDVAARCLGCGNCTQVCPTCFCTTVEDVSDLAGVTAERRRHWDSCFTSEFSYIHGGSVRGTLRARYRHWLTHKLSTWHDQFGTPGCVGCGRCIAWCPAAIDLTEEAAALCQASPKRGMSHGDA